MQIKVTRTFQLVTIHDVDLLNKKQDFELAVPIGLCSEHNCHAGVDALRSVKSKYFDVATNDTCCLGDTKYEIIKV